MRTSNAGDYIIYHGDEVETLGPGVANNVMVLIRKYAQQLSFGKLPMISLLGPGWESPWGEIESMDGFVGLTDWTPRTHNGSISFQFGQPTSAILNSQKLETVIAHELTHLRWVQLEHGPEFEARVWAILRGATFPKKHGRWSAETRKLVEAGRQEFHSCLDQFLRIKEG